jgi:hypothetical protein
VAGFYSLKLSNIIDIAFRFQDSRSRLDGSDRGRLWSRYVWNREIDKSIRDDRPT